MNLDNFHNLPYRHRESGELYTLILVGNTTATKQEPDPDNPNQNTWSPRAVFRKESTGEIFVRPHEEFLEKFEMHFPVLERLLDADLDKISELCKLKGNERTRRRLSVMSAARALWRMFPLIREESRIDLIRGLNLCDYIEIFTVEELDEAFPKRSIEIANMLNTVRGALSLPQSEQRLLKDEIPNVEDNIALIMLALVQSYNEYIVAVSINHHANNDEEEARLTAEVNELVKGMQDTAKWLSGVGVAVALPDMSVNLRFFNSQEAEEVLSGHSN